MSPSEQPSEASAPPDTAPLFIVQGSDLKIENVRLQIDAEGNVAPEPITPTIRTDMWPVWMLDAIEAAVEAQTYATAVAEADPSDGVALHKVLLMELRAAMRAVTGVAFAYDAFYASLKSRGPVNPAEAGWHAKRQTGKAPARHKQIYETWRWHLKLKEPGCHTIRDIVKTVTQLRSNAVHPGSKFQPAAYRADIGMLIDWHYALFRAENARTVVQGGVQVLDILTDCLDRGGDGLPAWKPHARDKMSEVVAAYRSAGLPDVVLAGEGSDPSVQLVI